MNRQIAVILVGSRGDANIGATARAMKNFGLSDLRLVDSVPHLTKTAYMWSVEARNILDDAKSFNTLDEAISDTVYAMAFTRRLGKTRKQMIDVSELGKVAAKKNKQGRIALVFGREDKGLTNEEIKKCDTLVTISTSNDLPSLNLAQAVLIACYNIYTYRSKPDKPLPGAANVTKLEIEALIIRLGKMLESLGYQDIPAQPLKTKILQQFNKLFGRAGLTARDIRMFEGLTTRVMGQGNPD